MAQYISCPRNLGEIKKKWFWKLTKRQTICFGIGLGLGFTMYFLTNKYVGTTIAAFLLMIFAAPGVICGIYHKNGFYLEQLIMNMINFYRGKSLKTYQTENRYDMIADEIECSKIRKTLKQNGVTLKKAKPQNNDKLFEQKKLV